MIRWVLAALGVTALLGAAAPPSFSIDPSSDLRLGGYVQFDSDTHVHQAALVLDCYQNGAIVFGYAGDYADPVLLGADVSPWRDNGGPADCTATLVRVQWQGGVESETTLAGPVTFTAEG